MIKQSNVVKTTTRAAFWLFFMVVFVSFAATAQAQPKKKLTQKEREALIDKKRPKEQRNLQFNRIPKRFWVTRTVNEETASAVADVNNAEWILDGAGKFPPKSKIVQLANTSKEMNYVLPMAFTPGHLRRFKNTGNYSVWFRAKESEFNDEIVNSLKLFRMKKRWFLVDLDDLTKGLMKNIDRVGEHSLMVMVGERELSTDQYNVLRKARSSIKEVVISENYPAKALAKLTKLKKTHIIIQVEDRTLDAELAQSLNKYKKARFGLWIKGTFTKEEATSFAALNHIDSFIIEPGKSTPDRAFVEILNSQGGARRR